jgi:hypothetical protein
VVQRQPGVVLTGALAGVGPVEHDRPANLCEPVPGDFAAHGSFDQRSRSHSPQPRATTHRGWLSLAGGIEAAMAAVGRLAGDA